ncbi:hypothetical protein [Hymenobacter sp. BRD67]|uniref:hypothetical protein n=1 Tax=Hymenobacter sp. BRD67 TaxID=2675877 RepID=UPI0015976F6A|nr:hypothetical protein [Hymenobacter sp. BRD67]QKG53529.1 hypothetical protein GKZ67_14150 [Hymenobacter sp. BRD67]
MVQVTSSPLDKALADHSILDGFFGRVPTAARRTPMRELISTLLSHRTTHADEELAYDRMLEAFGDWEGVLRAPLMTSFTPFAPRAGRPPRPRAFRIFWAA